MDISSSPPIAKDSSPPLMVLGKRIGWPSRSDVSPLRYPGGKRKLAPFVAAAVEEAGADMLVEPFAGGASVSISLLEAGVVERVALCDADPLVASFWQTVFSNDAAALSDMTRAAVVAVDEWRRIREWQPSSRLERAFKCLYLNRTSFSGSIHPYAGPMGGWGQSSENSIGSRFNQPKIADRIQQLSRLKDRVAFVEHSSYVDVLARAREGRDWPRGASSTFWYFDPPFFAKAGRLYAHHFDGIAHDRLATELRDVPGSWMLSYDDHPEATRLYGGHPGFARVAIQYTARVGADRENKPEVIVRTIRKKDSPLRSRGLDACASR